MVSGRNPKVKEKKLLAKMGYDYNNFLIGKVHFGKTENTYELIPRDVDSPVVVLREPKERHRADVEFTDDERSSELD